MTSGFKEGWEPLSADAIQAGLSTDRFGRNLVYLPETGSTNDEARRLAREGAPGGTLVITDYQTAGRGRLDRRWDAPAGSSLLMSLIFRPALAPHELQRLTMICGLSVVDSIESGAGLQAGLKWPNDVVVGTAKVGGVLTEVELQDCRVEYAVVGIGLNVNLDPSELPAGLLAPATSLSHLLGRQVARLPLLWAFLQAVESRYSALERGHVPHQEWAGRLNTLGQPVQVHGIGRVWDGVAEAVDENGALLVRLANGELETVVAGDVSLGATG